MNLSAIAIRRPVFAVMVTLALMVFGVLGLQRIGTDLFPDVEFPVVSVEVIYPGASPSEMESQVSKHIEDAVVSINGIDRIRTISSESRSVTIIIFDLDVDLQEAATMVRERVAQARNALPRDVEEPAVRRFDVGSSPVLMYTLSSDTRSIEEIGRIADKTLKPFVEQADGVSFVSLEGAPEREVHVLLDRARIESLGLSPLQVSSALERENVTLPAGHVDQGPDELSIRTVGAFATLKDIEDVVIATAEDGSAVRLGDVANIKDTYEEQRAIVRTNAATAIGFNVYKQSGTNTVNVCDAARQRLDDLKVSLPPDIHVNQIMDQSTFIRENAHEVETAIVFGGIMAVLVILFFLMDLRSTIISAIALPTSVISTFFVMYLLDFTINMMTLLGLSLAIGLLIDDAVVVRENITKHIERGVPPKQAALDGTKEIALSVLATTLSVVAVFVPVAFMSGIVGQFFREFGLTIAAAVLMSLFVAFTLDPMLSSRFSKPHDPNTPEKFARLKAPIHAVLDGMDHAYRTALRWSLSHKLLVGVMAFGSLVMTGVIGSLVGSEFVNQEDRGQYVVEIELPAGTSLTQSAKVTLAAEKELAADPNMQAFLSRVGLLGSPNVVQWRAVAVPKGDRDIHIMELRQKAVELARTIPGARVSASDPPFVEGAQMEAPIIVQVRAPSYETLEPLSRRAEKAVSGVPGVADVRNKFSPGNPELRVLVDRERAAQSGVSASAVALTLRTALEGMLTGVLRDGSDEVPIRVRMADTDRKDIGALLQTHVPTPTGPIALGDVTKLERGEGPASIERENRERQIQILAYPRGRPLGEIVPELREALDQIDWPPGASYHFDGQIRQMQEMGDSVGLAMLLAVVFIYIVLASQFESFIHPLTIMLTLPLAIVGAILGLFLSGVTLAMGAMIGIILLMGLVTKNAILLLDRAIVRVREHGEPPEQAIMEAGPERLRPILMTSAAMILGMLPTAVGQGDGSEFRAPMAISVIGGVISSTLLSLIVVPVFYLAIERFKVRVARWTGKDTAAPSGSATPAE